MEILAGCSIEESKKYNGKLVIPNEEGKSPDKVSVNIIVEDGNTDVFKELSGSEKCVTFIGEPATFCPTNMEGKVFNEVDYEYFKENEDSIPMNIKGITTLIRLPNGFCNMLEVKEICTKYPYARVIGGNLLSIEGVRIGRFDTGKDKMSPVYTEMYDTFIEVLLKDLDGIQEVIKRNKKKIKSMVEKEKKPREKKESKRVVSFNTLFGGNQEEF